MLHFKLFILKQNIAWNLESFVWEHFLHNVYIFQQTIL